MIQLDILVAARSVSKEIGEWKDNKNQIIKFLLELHCIQSTILFRSITITKRYYPY